MNLVNISNNFNDIYLFLRDENGNLKIEKDNKCLWYWYEPSGTGEFKSYNHVNLSKLYAEKCWEVRRQATSYAFESDLRPTQRYLIDKVNKIKKTKIRWQMYDIEILCTQLPRPLETNSAPDPISCITIYDNYLDEYKQWYLGDFKSEFEMIEDWISFMKVNSPDILLGHNQAFFDWPYLSLRIPDLAKRISPIGLERYGRKTSDYSVSIPYPQGISLIDTIDWLKSITQNKEESYALDSLMQKHLGYGKKFKKPDFSKLSEEIKGRNLEDVKGMVALEKKKQMISLYDSMRRMAKVEWEDLTMPLRLMEGLAFQEGKTQNKILPNKPKKQDKTEFQGAFRAVRKLGRFYNVDEYDLSGAYLYTIVDLCLDSANIVDEPNENTISVTVKDRVTQEITDTYNVKQDPNAILPQMVKKLVEEKNKYKALVKSTDPNDPKYEDILERYNAVKSISLSSWGGLGNEHFRLYDNRIASMITACVRDLIHYVEDTLNEKGYEIIQIDTDAIFVKNDGEDLTDYLDCLIQEWSFDRFGKKSRISFDKEGTFTKMLVTGNCHYHGWLQTKKGLEEIKRGIEVKRKGVSQFTKKFQLELFNKIEDGAEREEILEWVEEQKEEMKKAPLLDIACTFRFNTPIENYKSIPIGCRAMIETPNFDKYLGDDFYYIYIEPEYYYEEKEVIDYYREVPGKREGITKKEKLSFKKISELAYKQSCSPTYLIETGAVKVKKSIKKVKKARDVQAFDEYNQDLMRPVDWKKVIDANITKKLKSIFIAMNWDLTN